MKKGPSAIAGLLLAFSFLAGCSSEEKEPEPLVTVQATTVHAADISRTVTAEAVVFPIAQSVITPKINAPVKKFYVNRGQKVSQGQLLATLENRDLSGTALENQGAYEQAQAAYATSVGASLPEELQKAELDVQTAKQELDAQQKLYASREDLFKQGALPRKDLDAAAVSLAQAKSQYGVAKKHLDSLNAVGKEQTLRAAQGQLSSAKGRFESAEAQLSYSEIRSPISGVVTDRPLYPGEMASTSAPLMTVMDTSQIIAKAHVPQNDAALLHKGDKAMIELPGSDEKMSGEVSLVSPALDPNSTTVEVWVQVKNPQQKLRPGVTTQVSITAQTIHNALVVPPVSLLNASNGEAQVMVIDAQSVAHSTDVKVGVQTPQKAQILSGLNPGQQVVTEGAYGLPDKAHVKIEKANANSGESSKETSD